MTEYEIHMHCYKVYLSESRRYRITTGVSDALFLKMAASQREKALAARKPKQERLFHD